MNLRVSKLALGTTTTLLTGCTVANMEAQYQELFERFFPMLTVFYHYQFRTKKSLEFSLDWLKSPPYPASASQSKRIRSFAKDLIESRKKFCKCYKNHPSVAIMNANTTQTRRSSILRAKSTACSVHW